MKINTPYEKTIEDREGAVEYLRHQCKDCPKYAGQRGDFKCSLEDTKECVKVLFEVSKAFPAPKKK